MPFLAIIGTLGPSNATADEVRRRSMEFALSLLQTPSLFWVIILAGIILSPWAVRAKDPCTSKLRYAILAFSAVFFLSAILMFIFVRRHFINLFEDFFDSPEFFLIFPFQLGASSIGAVLLVLAWYYVHPLVWLRPRMPTKKMAIFSSFAPMLLTIGALAAMMLFSVMMMII